ALSRSELFSTPSRPQPFGGPPPVQSGRAGGMYQSGLGESGMGRGGDTETQAQAKDNWVKVYGYPPETTPDEVLNALASCGA
ncbi:hypothetical protein KIPB_017254, partial [Kipferlia bialata]